MKKYLLTFACALLGNGVALAADQQPVQIVFNPAGKVPAITMRSADQNPCFSHPQTPAGGKLHVGHGAAAAHEKCLAGKAQPGALAEK